MAAIAQHRPRAGSGEVNIQCIRVRPLRIAFHRSDFLLAHRLLKRSRDASGKPLELVVLRTQGKKTARRRYLVIWLRALKLAPTILWAFQSKTPKQKPPR